MTTRRILVVAMLIALGWLGGRLTSRSPAAAPDPHPATAAAPDDTGDDTGVDTAAPIGTVAPLSETDQYALLAELRTSMMGEPERQAAALTTFTARWRGQHVRWHVLVPRALCRHEETCFAVPFDHADPRARALAPIREGWLPRLALDAAGLARLDGCADACAVDVEGTLEEVAASTELPTAITLGEARIVAVAPAGPGERWMP